MVLTCGLAVFMCRCGLHMVFWWHIGASSLPPRCLLAASSLRPRYLLAASSLPPRSTTGLLFAYHYSFGIILVTLYSMVWDWRDQADPVFDGVGLAGSC